MVNKEYLAKWIEEYLFENSSVFQKLLSFLLLPLTIIYCFFTFLKKIFSSSYVPKIPVISIGNLTVGGSGKTPVTIELAKKYQKSAVVLRGYKRKSKGLVVIKDWERVLCGVDVSGDEAMLYAKALKNSLVIVCEKREKAIEKAYLMGAKVVFLDDGHSKYHIKKMDILIKPFPEPENRFCLPSGAYRASYKEYKGADLVIDEKNDIKRKTTVSNPTEKMVLVTAIAKPKRLDEFLPKVCSKVYFEDHHFFTKNELEEILKKYDAASILCTGKDAVKMEEFGLKLSILELDVELKKDIKIAIDTYIKDY